MGCGNSKDGNPDEIKSEMKWVKIKAYDDFFDSAKGFLENLEELRGTFQETLEEMHEIGRTEELVEPKLIEALRVFFWSVSAHKDGKFLEAGIKYTTDPVAFTANCSYMNWRTWEFSDALNRLVGGITSAPGQIADLASKLKEIEEQLPEIRKDIDGKVKAAGLGAMEQLKAVGYVGSNIATVAAGLAKAPKVIEHAKNALKEIQETVPKIPELMGNADEVGKKAAEKKMTTIDEIFDHFQTAPKKTPEQIKALKKEQKRKAKGKKPKKHGKKEGDKHKEGGKHKEGEKHKEGHKEEHHEKKEEHHEKKEAHHEKKEEPIQA